MVQVGHRGTVRRLRENFEKFSKISEFEFQNSGPSFFASVSPVYCKKNFNSIRTKLMEEIHFEVCHSGNLPPIIACCVSTGGRRAGAAAAVAVDDVRIQKCCVRIIPRILTRDTRTGGVRNCGRNRAVKSHRLVTFFPCGSATLSWNVTVILTSISDVSCPGPVGNARLFQRR